MRVVAEELERRVLLNAGAPDGLFNNGNPVAMQPLVGKYLADATAVAVQPDGKVLTAGHASVPGIPSGLIALARSNPDGSPDLSFGMNGAVLSSVQDGNFGSEQVAVQGDGKILESGGKSVLRFNSDGSPDLTFGIAGVVSIPGSGSTQVMMLAPDGSILIASGMGALQITRLNPNGSFDQTFDAGTVSVPMAGTNLFWTALSLDIDGHGDVLVGAFNDAGNDVFRFLPDGTPDPTFGRGGNVFMFMNGICPDAMYLEQDGGITLLGKYFEPLPLQRLSDTGAIDTTFGNEGIWRGDSLAPGPPTSYVFDPNGNALVAGFAGGNTYLMRIHRDGSLDPTFGGNTGEPGVEEFQFGDPSVDALAVAQNGTIFAAEGQQVFYNSPGSPFVTLRFDASGRWDTSFGGVDGYASHVFSGPVDTQINQVASAPDGRLVAAGVYAAAQTDDLFVARYNLDGTLDQSFGAHGVTEIHLSKEDDWLAGLAVLPTGQIVLGGSTFPDQSPAFSQFFVARLTPNGALDDTFGTDGVSTTVPGANNSSFSGAQFAVDPSGDLILAGTYEPDASLGGSLVIVRFRSDGSLDPTFGSDGVALPSTGRYVSASGLAVTGTGDVVVSCQNALLRLNANGTLDQNFGVGGISVVGEQGSVQIESVAATPDGDIVGAAYGSASGATGAFLLRVWPNGQLDASFGAGGFVSSPAIGPFYPAPMVVESDGKIVLTGSTAPSHGFPMVCRLDADGSLDTTFGTHGIVVLGNLGSGVSFWEWSSLNVDESGRITAAELATDSSGTFTGVMERYLGTESASITARVFNDANMNGSADSGEAGLPGATVYLDLNGNGVHDFGEPMAVTDAAGNYAFANLAPGSYVVREVVPTGYGQTSPMGYSQTVSVVAGQQAAGPDFGDVSISSVTMDLSYLMLLARNFGKPGTFATGDLNGDGTVNAADFLLFARNFGHTLPLTTPAIPRLAMRRR